MFCPTLRRRWLVRLRFATLRNTAINLHRLTGAENITEVCRTAALTANRRLDLLNPKSPACKPTGWGWQAITGTN